MEKNTAIRGLRSIPACAGEPGSPRSSTEAVGDGSIPACAGEPFEGSPGAESTTVYPRVCGGTFQLLTGVLHACHRVYPRVCGGTA